MIGLVVAATHSTAPWYYVLVPVVLVLGMAALRRLRGGGVRGPFGGGRTQEQFGGHRESGSTPN